MAYTYGISRGGMPVMIEDFKFSEEQLSLSQDGTVK